MLDKWVHVILAVLSSGILSSLLIFFIWRWCCYRATKPAAAAAAAAATPTRTNSFQARVAKLHHTSLIHQLDTSEVKKRGNTNSYYFFRRNGAAGGLPVKPGLFSWADHPSLITDAVEHGWSRFGFTVHRPLLASSGGGSARTALLELCAAATAEGQGGEDSDTEITWEVSNGSVDFMQKIRFNCRPRKKNSNNNNNNHNNHSIGNGGNTYYEAGSVIRAALPLPGPHLGNSAFPQEAYFEITILRIIHHHHHGGGCSCDDVSSVEGEKTKLIKENSDSLVGGNKVSKNEETKVMTSKDGRGDGKGGDVLMSVGMTTGDASVPLKPPGSFPGSIGFNSNGSIYLDGLKLVFESDKHGWGKTDKVIGCGFDPRRKMVFFTVDSHLVHVINCKAEEFGTPLYPTIAASTEATVLVNFGQSPFAYGPANGQRTPNPCFIGPLVRSAAATAAAAGFEDSRELFSMGRLDDSQYLNRSSNRGNNTDSYNGSSFSASTRRKLEYDDESDADLFEIVLESSANRRI